MRAAPAVSVDAHDDGLGRLLVALLAALAAGVAVRWTWLWLGVAWEPLSAWPAVGLLLVVVASLAVGIGAWRHARPGPVRLSWDGTTWLWQDRRGGQVPGQAMVLFDLGRWLLVAFDPDTAATARRWRVIGGDATQALRTALYAAPRVRP